MEEHNKEPKNQKWPGTITSQRYKKAGIIEQHVRNNWKEMTTHVDATT